jgi:hypothetical protein
MPGIAEYGWVLERRAEWGPDYEEDIQYQVRVRGDFPSTSSQQVVTTRDIQIGKTTFLNFVANLFGRKDIVESDEYELKERFWFAVCRSKEHYRHTLANWCNRNTGHPLIFGVDPAWYGDDRTVIFLRRGPRMFPPGICTKFDGYAVAQLILQYVDTYRWGVDEKPIVMIDVNGVGASAHDALRHSKLIRLIPFNSQKAPTAKRFKRPGADPNEYPNMRSEIAFAAKSWLRDGGGIVPHDELERELLAAHYYIDGTGRLCVEKKSEIKQRLGNSPDLADAFSIACCDDAIPPEIHIPPDLHKHIRNTARFSGLPGKGY